MSARLIKALLKGCNTSRRTLLGNFAFIRATNAWIRGYAKEDILRTP
jgi:hypothetical protein